MKFKGLFIGIDRYASPNINWLNCAKNDAIALHSLFSDNLDGNSVLLVDENATRNAIKSGFKQLRLCDEDDFVVIGFSGHGSDSHELVTYDADTLDLANTCIPLNELFDWFKQIPAKRLLFIVDCCFSGGMGSKALQTDFSARGIKSAEGLLSQLSGEGRLIFTASSATEPAYENHKYGHGYLTYYFIEALQGAEAVTNSGKVNFYSLLKYVTDNVIQAAAQLGKEQNPTLRGTIEGSFTLPIFVPGDNFKMFFPDYALQPVTEDLQSLLSHGFPQPIIDIWSCSIQKLNSLQLAAINDYKILLGEHLVVSAPTSSGKTMVGELAALAGAVIRKRTIFLLPLKALVNDKHRQFSKLYGQYGIRTIRATGDSNDDIPFLMRGQYDICLMTYEKFTALVLGFPHILEQANTVVIDEVQMIADEGRGANLEFILTILRVRRREGIEPQIIALSAVIGETNGLEQWLNSRLLKRTERPVPLDEGIINANGDFQFVDSETAIEKVEPNHVQRIYNKNSSQDWIIPLVRKLVSEGKQVIVFRETRGEARGAAKYLADNLDLPIAQRALDKLPQGDPSLASKILHDCLNGGIAFHISDLDRDERLTIEEEFRESDSQIRVIVATTTLAMGVNTPAEAVIIAGLEHPGDPAKPYSIAEYKNIVGRAGRLGYAARGTSYLLALTHKEAYDYWRHYVMGKPEDLVSRFLDGTTDSRSLIVRVLVTVRRSSRNTISGMTAEEIISFLECSFGAFQKAQRTPEWKWDHGELIRSLNNLKGHNLITQDELERYRLTELGWLAGQGGIEVESVTRLVELFRGITANQITDPALIAAAQITVELDQVYFPINSKGPQKEFDSWNGELQRQPIPYPILNSLRSVNDIRQAAGRVKKTVACLLWITDKPLTEIESVLTRHGGRFDGIAGPMRSAAIRTHDLLGTVGRIAEILHPELELEERINKLFVRLEVGVPAKIFDLAKRIGLNFSRSDYQSFLNAGATDMEHIKNLTDNQLLQILGAQTEKLSLVKNAMETFLKQESQDVVYINSPALPAYEG